MGNPLPVDLPAECRKADKILRQFVDPVNGLDRVIPLTVLRRAKGFAIFSIFRLGFLLTARAGSGVVIAKLPDGTWSAPSALGIGGIGGGFSAGAEVTDFIVVLNSRSAVRSFMATGSLQLGGNLSVAVGPLGRSAEASGALNSSGKVTAMFSYSKSQGLFGGLSLEGTILVDRSDANHKAYGRGASARQILSGGLEPPSFAMTLIDTIERLSLTGRMTEATRADGLEPGTGRDSWDIDDDSRSSAGHSGSGRAGHNSSGLDNYFSQAEINDRQRRADREEVPSGQKSPKSVLKPKVKDEQDPFATSDEEESYSMNRENATRNAGTYAFSSAGGGSATNSPTTSRGGTDYGRSRSNSKSGKIAGYFDEALTSTKEKKSSPMSSKRPSFSHRKSSSTFSLSKFGIGKGNQTPPLASMTPSATRKTPPPSSFLGNGFQQDFSRSSESEDDGGYNRDGSYEGYRTSGGYKYDTATESNYGGAFGSDNSPYFSGASRKTSPADAVRLAAAGRSDYSRGLPASNSGLSSARQQGAKSSDAFGDIWDSERAREEMNGMDALDRELQGGGRFGSSKKSIFGGSSSSNNYSSPATRSGAFSSPQRPASGSQVDRSRFSKSPTFLSKTFRTSSGNGTRSKSYKQELTSDASDHDDERGDIWSTPSKQQGSSRDAILGVGGTSSTISGGKISSYLRGDRATTPRSTSYNQQQSTYSPSNSKSTLQPSIFDDDFAVASSSPPSSSSPPPTSSTPTANANASGSAGAGASASVGSHLPSQGRVIAAFDFQAQEPDDLPLIKGEVITVLKKTQNIDDWWLGRNDKGQVGSFPGNYVDLLD